MLLNFALYTDLDESDQLIIRGCTADLYAASTSADNSSCEAPAKTTTTTSSLQLGWNTAAAAGFASEAVDALEQLLAYETMNSFPCNETINFAYSGQTSVGVYMGSALHRQGLLPSIIQDLIERIDQEGVTETQIVQLCNNNSSARYTMGIIVNSNGDLLATQQALQSWRNATCITALDSTSIWNKLTFTSPVQSHKSSNSTYNWNRRNTGVKVLPVIILVHEGNSH
jgi:chitinase